MAAADVLVDRDWLEKHLDDPTVVVIEVDEDPDQKCLAERTTGQQGRREADRAATKPPLPAS